MIGKAHEMDLLIVASVGEGSAWRKEFDQSQLYVVGHGLRYALEGRRFRRAYITDWALERIDQDALEVLHRGAVVQQPGWGEITNAKFFRGEEPAPSIWDRLVDAWKGLAA